MFVTVPWSLGTPECPDAAWRVRGTVTQGEQEDTCPLLQAEI